MDMQVQTYLPPAKVMQLARPIMFDGREFTTLNIQPPILKYILRGDEQLRFGENAHTNRLRDTHIVANCAGVPVAVVEQLLMTEFMEALQYIGDFLSSGRATGDR